MIELLWNSKLSYADALLSAAKFITWLTSVITQEENDDVYLEGYFTCFNDKTSVLSTLLVCKGVSHNRIRKIIQQPPGEFIGKYFPNEITEAVWEKNHEPDPVVCEKTEEGEMESAGSAATAAADTAIKAGVT